MGLYEHLPYTNFHELNLDAIVKAINNLPETVKQVVNDILIDYTVPDGSITTDKLANLAVTNDKIAGLTIQNPKLAANSVGTTKIQSGAVTTIKLANSAVTADKLAEGAVDETKIDDGAVTTDKISDKAITSVKLNLEIATHQSSLDVFSLTSGTTFQDVRPMFGLDSGLYIGFLWVRKGLTSGVTGTHLLGARLKDVYSGNIKAVASEIRTVVTAAAATASTVFVFRQPDQTSQTLPLQLQAFQSSGVTNESMQMIFQTLRIGE